jgi:hypothetical protein
VPVRVVQRAEGLVGVRLAGGGRAGGGEGQQAVGAGTRAGWQASHGRLHAALRRLQGKGVRRVVVAHLEGAAGVPCTGEVEAQQPRDMQATVAPGAP